MEMHLLTEEDAERVDARVEAVRVGEGKKIVMEEI